MDQTINSALIGAAGGILIAVVTAVGPLWYNNRGLKQQLKDPLVFARALATGYFYNFLYKIGAQANGSGLHVKFNAKETGLPEMSNGTYTFATDAVTIVCVVPTRLSSAAIHRVESEAKRHSLAHIQFPDRDRPVNYSISTDATGKIALTIIDPAAPCFVIKDYLDRNPGDRLKGSTTSNDRGTLEAQTLGEFRKTIDDLTEERTEAFIGKIAWREME